MKALLLSLEFLSGLILVVAILLHAPKGEGLGGIGGQARMFNTQSGLEAGLNRFTFIVGAIFMVCATLLGVFF